MNTKRAFFKVIACIIVGLIFTKIGYLLPGNKSEFTVSNVIQDLAEISSSSQKYFNNTQLAGGGGHSLSGSPFMISFDGNIVDGQHASNQ